MGTLTFQNNADLNYDQWLLARNKTLGASEVGPVIFGSRWSSNLEIYYSKVTGQRKNVQNLRCYLGKKTENIHREMYCYYSDSDESIVTNETNGTKIKEAVDSNITIFNSDFTYLSVTPDGEILPVLRYEGRGKGALELKNSNKYVLESYQGGLPTDNIIQVSTQMMVGLYPYADISYFLDNRNIEEFHFERKDNKKMEAMIVAHTKPFWDNVLKARPIYNQMYESKRLMNMRLYNELKHELELLEPPPQNSAGYLNYINQKYKDRIANVGVIAGTQEQFDIAKKHKEIAKKIKKLEEQQREFEIQLKMALQENTALDFGKNGRVTWMGNKNNSRIFLNKIK